MPPSLATVSPATAVSHPFTSVPRRAGWLLPAGLLLVLLALGRWVQHPVSLPPTSLSQAAAADQPTAPRVARQAPARLPGPTPAVAL